MDCSAVDKGMKISERSKVSDGVKEIGVGEAMVRTLIGGVALGV